MKYHKYYLSKSLIPIIIPTLQVGSDSDSASDVKMITTVIVKKVLLPTVRGWISFMDDIKSDNNHDSATITLKIKVKIKLEEI